MKDPLLRRRGATNIATLALFTTVFWETFIYNPELAREGVSTFLSIASAFVVWQKRRVGEVSR